MQALPGVFFFSFKQFRNIFFHSCVAVENTIQTNAATILDQLDKTLEF